jgi:hypothetical protein
LAEFVAEVLAFVELGVVVKLDEFGEFMLND